MMKMLKENRAQGSMEILLLIGGAIAVATIVGIIIKNIANAPSGEIQQGITETEENLGGSP